MLDIAIYEGPGCAIEVRVDRETVWLAQRLMAEPVTTEEYSVVQKAIVKIVDDRGIESLMILSLG